MAARVCCLVVFFFSCCGDHRDLHSFPTRRSSDLTLEAAATRSRPCSSLVACGLSRLFSMSLTVMRQDRKSTRLNSSHVEISYAVFCLKKKNSTLTLQQRSKTATMPSYPDTKLPPH